MQHARKGIERKTFNKPLTTTEMAVTARPERYPAHRSRGTKRVLGPDPPTATKVAHPRVEERRINQERDAPSVSGLAGFGEITTDYSTLGDHP
jgi:hypothetical protein